MGTTCNEIYDLFMMKVTDYRLDALFQTSEESFETYLRSFLEFAISDFSICTQDLDYNVTTMEFSDVLNRTNKRILITLMMKHWMQKNANDITQMNLHAADRNFKVPSEAPNMREKTAMLNAVKEECSQLLSDYGYSNNDWDNWYAQEFEGT